MLSDRWTRRPNAPVAVLLALAIAGAAPVRRTIAVHQGFGARAAIVALASCVGVILLHWVFTVRVRDSERSAWTVAPWLVLLFSAVVVGTAGGRIVGLWSMAGMVLAMVVVYSVHRPDQPMDRRSVAAVAVLCLGSAYVARNDERLGDALLLFGAAFVVAAVASVAPSAASALLDRITARVHRWRSGLPDAVWCWLAPGALWIMLTAAAFTRGLLRGAEYGYRAFSVGLDDPVPRSGFAVFGLLAVTSLIVTTGAVVVVRGWPGVRTIAAAVVPLVVGGVALALFAGWVWPDVFG